MTNDDFKSTLWDAADKLRGSVSAAQYKYPVLGLVFLKYISDLFDAQAQVIRDRLADPASDYFIDDAETRELAAADFVSQKTFYDADNVFWVPAEARFGTLLKGASQPNLAQVLDAAMGQIEQANPSLKGVLYREFSRLALAEGKLGELMNEVAKLKSDPKSHGNAAKPPDNMTEEEWAFYQALAENESAVRDMGHPALRALAQELTDKIRKSATIDWQNRKAARGKMIAMVKVLLARHKYPPDKSAEALDRVIEQAETLADTWAFEQP